MRTRDVARAAQSLLLLAWSFSVVPALLQVVQVGRRASLAVDLEATQTPLSGITGTAISTAIIGLCVGCVLNGRRGEPWPVGRLAVFVAPWAVLGVLCAVLAHDPIQRQIVAYPLIGAAFWALRPPTDAMFRLFGRLTVTTAVLSIALAVVQPDKALAPYVPDDLMTNKAIIGGNALLAGVYTHPNELGLVLGLGAPAVLLLRSRPGRVLGFAAVGFALLWSASRTGVVAACLGLVVTWWLRRERGGPGVPTALFAGGALLTVLTPLLTSDPLAYSKRGVIWLASLHVWPQRPWFGGGPDYYLHQLLTGAALGPYATHGHNLLVNTLTVGGLVGVAAMCALLLGARRLARGSVVGTAYVTALMLECWLEVLFDFRNLGAYGYAVWVPLAIVYFGATAAAAPEPVQ